MSVPSVMKERKEVQEKKKDIEINPIAAGIDSAQVIINKLSVNFAQF